MWVGVYDVYIVLFGNGFFDCDCVLGIVMDLVDFDLYVFGCV